MLKGLPVMERLHIYCNCKEQLAERKLTAPFSNLRSTKQAPGPESALCPLPETVEDSCMKEAAPVEVIGLDVLSSPANGSISVRDMI